MLWDYKVDSTTYLPYYRIDSAGNVTNYICYTVDPPDALSVVNAFMFSYKVTGNGTYLDHAKTVLNAVNTYMRHPTYDTIITGVDARDGSMLDDDRYHASRGGDQLANFIETALFLYELSGDQTYLNWATYQADKFTQYAWDDINKVYHYKPSSTGYEDYVPSFSVALLHLYGYTNNQTYLNNAKNNYLAYMTQLKRNGLTMHMFMSDGKYGHEAAHFMYDVPVIAALLYKYTGDQTYLDISDEYAAILLDYYYPIDAGAIYSDNFNIYSSLTYLKRQEYTTDLLYRFMLPSSSIDISWAYGSDLHGRYRGIASAPIDVSFERDAIHLYDVSGNGTIKFHPDIKKVYITPQANSRIRLAMLSSLSIIPPSGAVDVEIFDSLIDIDYQNSVLTGLSVNNVDREMNLNNNGSSSMTITPASGSIDTSITTWNTSGTYYKKWTEIGDENTGNTTHTIGDLKADTYYTIKVDGNRFNTYLSNDSGEITFTYTGGYSSHDFEVEEDTTPPVAFDLLLPSDNSCTNDNTPTLSWNASSDSESGLAKYQLYIDSSLDTDNISSSATSVAPANNLTCGSHSWFVKAIDNAGNSTSSSTFNLTMACGSGMPPSFQNPPAQPKPTPENPNNSFSVAINNNDEYTNSKTVTLKLNAGSDTERMAISNTEDFKYASQIPYQENIEWDLSDCKPTPNPSQEGNKSSFSQEGNVCVVYAKFYTQYGVASEVVSDSIIYTNKSNSVIPNGSLIRSVNDYKVYIINNSYKRHILDGKIFDFYGHLNWDSIQEVDPSTINNYQESFLIRASNDYKVYEIDNDKTKHWLNITAEEFINSGRKWEMIYVVNEKERDFYKEGEEIK